jgi:L-lactate dehydrogenase complex protein LldG
MQELIQEFKDNAELTTATVELVSKHDISKVINEQIKNEKNVLVSVSDNSLLDTLSPSIKFIKTPSNEELKSTQACLTDSVCGIAETGSVVIDNDNGYTSFLTMLSTKHIVILSSNNLYERPRDIFEEKNLFSKSSFSIITGPSATADMGSLVRGVHGPEHLHIILVVDDEK